MKRPEIKPVTPPSIPHYERHETRRGAPLYTLHNSNQGVVRVSFVFRAGTSWQSHPFSASTVVNSLTEGTLNMTGREIAEALDYHGSYYDANIDRDWAVVTFCSLKRFINPTLDVAEEVILRPTFPQEEIASYCAKRKEQLRVQRSKPDQLSRELFGRTLFGENHPYGITSSEEYYDSLDGTILREFYTSHYNAANAFAVLCGDFGDEVVERVKEILGSMAEGAPLRREIPPASPTPKAFWPMSGAVQSSIKIGVPLFARSHPDFIPMQVLATALGGYFGSRLMHNLREEHGYTYGAYAAMINLDAAGYFVMSSDVASEHTEEAIGEMFGELERIASEPIDEQELAIVKKIIMGDVMRIFDGPFGAADVTIENIQNGEANDYTERFIRRVESLTPSELRNVAQDYLSPEKCVVAVVGRDE